MSLIEEVGFADGIASNSVKMILDGVPVLALEGSVVKFKLAL